ncbi:MAG: stage III sporulation protein AG [[Ruminococcus] gnavus]|nr:stage III sporulation protein AG [Mediterraneibacter gnavus]
MENRWKQWITGAKGKLPVKQQLLILLLIGVLLAVIVSPVSKPQEAGAKEESEIMEKEVEQGKEAQYETAIEARVEELLHYVEGVGNVKVMVTLKSSGEKIIEKDRQSQQQKTEEEDSKGGSRLSEDQSIQDTSIYTQDTDGSQVPYVREELAPEIAGIVIAADGGDDPVVVRNLTEAVQALFGVEAHKIKIMKRTNV